jgi:hypothetical protein
VIAPWLVHDCSSAFELAHCTRCLTRPRCLLAVHCRGLVRCELQQWCAPALHIRLGDTARRGALESFCSPAAPVTMQPEPAIAAQRKALPVDPGTTKLDGNRAFKAFRLEEAIELYSAALAAAPDEPVYISNRSAALFEAGRYAACVADVEAALACQPDSALTAKLALRAARAELWGDSTDRAAQWLAHPSLETSTGTAAEQRAEVTAHVQATRTLAERNAACSEELRAVAAGIDADAPGLLLFNARPDVIVTGHDRTISMLAGAHSPLTFGCISCLMSDVSHDASSSALVLVADSLKSGQAIYRWGVGHRTSNCPPVAHAVHSQVLIAVGRV